MGVEQYKAALAMIEDDDNEGMFWVQKNNNSVEKYRAGTTHRKQSIVEPSTTGNA